MFDLTNEKLEEKMVEIKARDMFANMLLEAILTSDAPEHMKLCVSVIGKVKANQNALNEIVEKYCMPENEANTETLKKIKEYLELVEVGIKQFVETTPFVMHTEEE